MTDVITIKSVSGRAVDIFAAAGNGDDLAVSLGRVEPGTEANFVIHGTRYISVRPVATELVEGDSE